MDDSYADAPPMDADTPAAPAGDVVVFVRQTADGQLSVGLADAAMVQDAQTAPARDMKDAMTMALGALKEGGNLARSDSETEATMDAGFQSAKGMPT